VIAPPGAGRAPDVTLPLRYLVAAAAAFVAAAAGVAWLAHELAGHYYHPRLLALTHTVALGWLTLTIMGASYQLVPIVLERPVWSQRLARWQFVALVAGIVGMVAHFYVGRWSGLVWAAGLVAVGILAHLANIALTLRGLARWSFTAWLLAGAHAGLGLTLVFGLVLAMWRALGLAAPDPLAAVHAHFHLALLGWIAPMVIGVAARVYPMFLLAPEPGGRLGAVQLAGLGLGVPAVVAGLLAAPALVPAGTLAVAVAIAAHGAWVAATIRQRRRPALDWGLWCVLTGAAFLAPATALGLGLAFGGLAGPGPAVAYAALALGGWGSLTIVGMMLKIVPFLVWQRVYAPRAGRAAVPTLGQLGWRHAEAAAYALLTAGTLVLAAAAAVLLTLGALAFAATLARVLSHLAAGAPRRPAPIPTAARAR
jgi:hypothetical protein